MRVRTFYLSLALLPALFVVSAREVSAGELEQSKKALADRYAQGERRGERERSMDGAAPWGLVLPYLPVDSTTSTSTTTTTVSEICDPVAASGDPTALLVPLDDTFDLVDFFGDGPTGADPATGSDQHNDDDSAALDLPFDFDLFGERHSRIFINNNGNLTFDSENEEFAPDSLPSPRRVIAPFWADVDTGNTSCDRGRVWQRLTDDMLVVTWDNVGHYKHSGTRLNTFQVVISDGTVAVMGLGNNVCFSFAEMSWTTGDTDGFDGFGSEPAIVGADRGNAADFFQVGGFNHAGVDRDGPYGEHDGVDWLDDAVICFSTIGGSGATTTTTTTSTVPVCGNGLLESGEACDDGNTSNADCCTSECAFAAAGSACVPDRIPFGDSECFDLVCNGAGTCEALKNVDPCDDGQFCTVDDVCTNGNCRGKTRSCDDGIECTSEVCDDIRDRCLRIEVHTLCNDGSFCNGYEQCDMLEGCKPGTPVRCVDTFGCTVDRCDDEQGRCVFEPDHGYCADDSFCNGAEVCDLSRGCIAGTPPACADPHSCTTDACDETAGACVHATDDASCDDADVCNGYEICDQAGGCSSLSPLVCDDGNACNGVETCDPVGGCRPGTPPVCDDGNVCNGAESCDAELGCVGGTPLSCDDGNVCNGTETCDAELGCAVGTPLSCNDGDVCNGTETCNAELGCVNGTPLTCDDGDVCNGAESCDTGIGCVDGDTLTCDDGDACNGTESCDADDGCVRGTPATCAELDSVCAMGRCDAESGDCVTIAVNEGLPCGDPGSCGAAVCRDGFCEAEAGGAGGMCDWTVVALADTEVTDTGRSSHRHGRRGDGDGGPSFRAQPFSRITGDVCVARGAIGVAGKLNGSVASRHDGDRPGLLFGSWASVEQDIVTAGTSVRVLGHRATVPGTWVHEVPAGVVKDKKPLGVVDTTGHHARLLDCRDAARGIAGWVERVGNLATDGVADHISVGREETIAFEIDPADEADGIAVFEFASLHLERSARLLLSRAPSARAQTRVPVVIRVTGEFALDIGASIRFDETLSPEDVLWVVGGRRCDARLASRGAGTLLCPNARIDLGPVSKWSGAAYGLGVTLGVGARIEGRAFSGF